jgi:hypothetical protein
VNEASPTQTTPYHTLRRAFCYSGYEFDNVRNEVLADLLTLVDSTVSHMS